MMGIWVLPAGIFSWVMDSSGTNDKCINALDATSNAAEASEEQSASAHEIYAASERLTKNLKSLRLLYISLWSDCGILKLAICGWRHPISLFKYLHEIVAVGIADVHGNLRDRQFRIF